MKKYIQPEMAIVVIETVQMIAASGDAKTDVTISDTSLDGTTFNSRIFSVWGDDDEE